MRIRLVFAAVAAVALLPLAALADSWDNWRYAVKMGQEAEVVRMLDAGQDIDMQNEEGWTALHIAAEDGNERMVRYLLARGARTDLKTTRGRTAYDVAEGYSAIRAAIRAKMAPPADPFAPYLGGAAAAPAKGRPAAPVKASNGACAAANANPANDGRTPATRPRLQARDAVWYNQPADLAALLDDCVGVNSKDTDGSTLLHVAAERNRIDIAKLLIAKGASRTATDHSGKRPADYAASPEMQALLGARSPGGPSTPVQAGGANEAYCKQMWHEATALCGLGEGRCTNTASVRYSACLKKGTWY
ncbi:ankyrin repeat domain-containing protein [Phenylobacterium sp. VNQ135]|uniref:ankyrin repeat domain-containing protein n=1 Tax=Phenylobacterium sp. VNQ135 TaxID=3400922 RepID=UPI003C00E1E4